MIKFILKKIAYAIITIFIISTMTFLLIHAIPGDQSGNIDKSRTELSHASKSKGVSSTTLACKQVIKNSISPFITKIRPTVMGLFAAWMHY